MPEIWRLGEGREVSAPQRELEVKPFVRVQGRDSEGKFAKLDQEQIDRVRKELREQRIDAYYASEQDPSRDELFDPIPQYQLPNLEKGGGEMGILGDKLLKRKVKEVKEKQPRSYKEKLLVISDLQLLHETNEEAVGALVKYIEAEAKSFTHVVLNGDIIDFQQQSGFRKDNQLGDSVTQDEQVAGKWFIDFIGEHCKDAKKVFMKGNHEARYDNMYKDSMDGRKQYMRPFKEVFGLEDWEVHEYGQGESYDWHGRKIRHGSRGGLVSNIPKIEMERNWRSTTVGHAVSNRFWEFVDSDGNSFTSFVHAGFSKPAGYDRSGDKVPSNGFGVYYYAEVGKKKVENAYQVIMPANHSVFLSPEGNLYDGRGYNLRKEIGL